MYSHSSLLALPVTAWHLSAHAYFALCLPPPILSTCGLGETGQVIFRHLKNVNVITGQINNNAKYGKSH